MATEATSSGIGQDALPNLARFDAFVAAILASNPFVINRINDPSQLESDVKPIHAREFQRLITLGTLACDQGRGMGALLLGGAGTGKSHLLARIASWASTNDGLFDRACFVFLHNIHASAAEMCRYLLKCCVSKLVEDRLDRLNETLLFRIVETAIRTTAAAEKISTLNSQNREHVYGVLSGRLGGDSQIFAVIFQFFCSIEWAIKANKDATRRHHLENAAIAVRWLKGELLDADDARRIKLLVPSGRDTVQLSEDQVEAVLLAFARLARVSKRPFILCVDQVDNMRSDQFTALCQTLHSLIDNSNNMLVVVSGVRETILDRIRDRSLPEAFADRLDYARPVDLRRLDRSEGRQILEDRLYHFLAPFEDVPEVKDRFSLDSLFPLGATWLAGTQADMLEVRPRDIITWGNDRWSEIQHRIQEEGATKWIVSWEKTSLDVTEPPLTPEQLRAAIDRKVAEKLEEALNSRRLDRAQLPADASNLIGLTQSLLEQCLNRAEADYTLASVQTLGKREVDMIIGETLNGVTIRNHVQVIITRSKVSAAFQLRKLKDSPDADRRILVTDEEREPLSLGAEGQKRYQELQTLGGETFTHIGLDFDQYAMLASMMAVIDLARSRDLEIAPRGFPHPIDESQVIDSFHRQNRYRSMPLLRIFLTEEPYLPKPAQKVPRDQFRQFLLDELNFSPPKGLLQLEASFRAQFPRESWAAAECFLPQFVVRELHDEGRIKATPCDNDIILQSS